MAGRTDAILAPQNTNRDEAGGIETQEQKFLGAGAGLRAAGNTTGAITIALGFDALAALASLPTTEAALAAIPATLTACRDTYSDVLSTIRGAAPDAALFLPAYYNPFPADPDSPAASLFFEACCALNGIIEDLAGELGGTRGRRAHALPRQRGDVHLSRRAAGGLCAGGEAVRGPPAHRRCARQRGGLRRHCGRLCGRDRAHPVPAALPLSLGALAALGALGLRRCGR